MHADRQSILRTNDPISNEIARGSKNRVRIRRPHLTVVSRPCAIRSAIAFVVAFRLLWRRHEGKTAWTGVHLDWIQERTPHELKHPENRSGRRIPSALR